MEYLVRLNLFLMAISLSSCQSNKSILRPFEEYTTAQKSLWPDYTRESTVFKIWSPVAETVRLQLYKNGFDGEPYATHALQADSQGVWEIEINGDLHGTYYTFQLKTDGAFLPETPGIYAQAVGVGGKRAMVVDLSRTDPTGWENDRGPEIGTPNEAIIYETHLRDISMHPQSGIQEKGKYLGLTEPGSKTSKGLSTGLDHIEEMGITHVHLLPTNDFKSIDESRIDSAQYNWGYDPLNFNVPEGSYTTDAEAGAVRINEFKQMVKAFHDRDIGVIIDAVFNHTADYENAAFNLEVPGYYYRHDFNGFPSNASACGNETASERPMMRKFIVESVSYWAKEYHIDGFRFDLMAILDIETMNEVANTLKNLNPNIIIYGEGWAPGDSPYSKDKRAFKFNMSKIPEVSAFSDEIRDGLKGSVFQETGVGFVNGQENLESVKMGIVGCIDHPQIDYKEVNTSKRPWAIHPWQSIAYVSCHDNHTLYDKLKLSRPDASEAEIIAMDMLANAVVLTAQGISFLHAGAELLRSKQGIDNSYESPDSINQINWSKKLEHTQIVHFYKNLIALRKAHPAFRMKTGGEVRKHLTFKTIEKGLIGYEIKDHANGDIWRTIHVIYNARPKQVDYRLNGVWTLAVVGDHFNSNIGITDLVKVPPLSMLIAYQ